MPIKECNMLHMSMRDGMCLCITAGLEFGWFRCLKCGIRQALNTILQTVLCQNTRKAEWITVQIPKSHLIWICIVFKASILIYSVEKVKHICQNILILVDDDFNTLSKHDCHNCYHSLPLHSLQILPLHLLQILPLHTLQILPLHTLQLLLLHTLQILPLHTLQLLLLHTLQILPLHNL